MKALPDVQAFRASSGSIPGRDRRPVAIARANTSAEVHNARGLVIAVSMSAACWAAIALAFLL